MQIHQSRPNFATGRRLVRGGDLDALASRVWPLLGLPSGRVRTMASPDFEEDRFPGLREYLAAKFGPAAGLARIDPLATAPGAKGGGYGVPQLVRWRSSDGDHRY